MVQKIGKVWGNLDIPGQTEEIVSFRGLGSNGRGDCLDFTTRTTHADGTPPDERVVAYYPYELDDVLKQPGLTDSERAVIKLGQDTYRHFESTPRPSSLTPL